MLVGAYPIQAGPCEVNKQIIDWKEGIESHFPNKFSHFTIRTDPDLWVGSKFHKFLIKLGFTVTYFDQAVRIKETLKIRQKLPFFGHFFFMYFEVISTAWSQLMTLHFSSTNFWGNFQTTYNSGSLE